jgi:hypothetical protein
MKEYTKAEIDKIAWNVLRDAGLTEPPIKIDDVLVHLKLNRSFYDLQDPGLFERAKHRLKIGGQKFARMLGKLKLQAVLFYGEDKIVIDSSLPKLKQAWPSFHESSHRILPWHHASFDYGDTAQTLEHDWHEKLEAEANYCASNLMFCGPKFTDDSRDTTPEWSSIERLKKRYGCNLPTTLRRYMHFGPNVPMSMVVSTPLWEPKPVDQLNRCRHFVPSKLFAVKYSNVCPLHLIDHVDSNAVKKRGGPVADFTFSLSDDNGVSHEFRAETFYNGHYLQTLFVEIGKLTATGVLLKPETALVF